MLQVHQVSKAYGIETVLEEVSFVVNPGERVGLVGPNGSGKSTLLNVIAGVEPADRGSVTLAPGATPGYLRQGVIADAGRTLRDEVESGLGESRALRARLDDLAGEMAGEDNGSLTALMAAYGEAEARFAALGGYDLDHRIAEVLAHLGLDGIDPLTPIGQLSGGQQTRAGLAGVLIANPSLLLLDEPTNHLDIAALEWLEGFLRGHQGAALIVSHDRAFLDATVTRILELDDQTHRLTAYTGNYSDYEAAKAHALDRQWQAYSDQQAEIQRIEGDIHRTKMHAMSVELTTTPGQPGVRRYAKKVAKKAKSREKKLERFLESEERVEKPEQRWGMKLDFGEMTRGGQDVIRLEGIGHRYDGAAWLFREVTLTLRHGERLFLPGPNGTGKSTLAQIIMGQLAPAEGTVRIGANVRIGYMPQKQEALDPALTPLDAIRTVAPLSETEARRFLHQFLFAGDDVFVPVGELSYGERARLLLAKLIGGGANALLLDEPVNHLDIPARQRFEAALDAFPGAILIIAHDRAFIDRFATGIWALEGGTVRRYVDREEMGRVQT